MYFMAELYFVKVTVQGLYKLSVELTLADP